MTAVSHRIHSSPAQSSAETVGLLRMLEERDPRLKRAALEQLVLATERSWPEIADALPLLERLYDEESHISERQLAALVIAKTYYHLEEYSFAMDFVLGAGSLFDPTEKSEFARTLTSKLIDEYVRVRVSGELPSASLESVVEHLLSSCLKSCEYRMGLGVALEANRLDWVKRFMVESGDLSGMLRYLLRNLGCFISDKKRRSEVLTILLQVYAHTPADKRRDWSGLAQCFFLLGEVRPIASLFKELLTFEDDPHWGWLMAYQVAFDLADNEDQRVNLEILSCEEFASLEAPSDVIENIKSVLTGKVQTKLNLEFLYRNNKTDLLLLDSLKSDKQTSVPHNGVVIAHALMQAGTASDAFLRNNLTWLAKASQWAKFTATASLGIVHKGHIKESKNILSTYLPRPESERKSPFSEGGALFALGLVHANLADSETKTYLSQQLETNKENEVLQVGGCLGLGMSCLATRDTAVYEQLKNVLFTDNAVAGEAAGLAIGCVMAGSGDHSVSKELLRYALDTEHEKIVRACTVGLALIWFRQEQAADRIIVELTSDSDAVVRYGGMFSLGMAYCGTAHNDTIRKLLHFSVSDASDDVRRAAVISLGFVLSGESHQLPKVLKLLAESYNPHVRYAVCLALGIACAGKAAILTEALDLIEPLTKDVSQFVRQGAFMGLGLLCQEISDKQMNGRVVTLRDAMLKAANDVRDDSLARFGAEVGLGLMGISGRNAVCSFFSRSGRLRLASAVGFCLFAQSWFSFPLILTVSLAAAPTACIALNERLKMPRQFAAKTKAGQAALFAYPEPTKPVEKAETVKVASVVLSAKKRTQETSSSLVIKQTEQDTKSVETEDKKKIENLVLFNPFRVVPGQERSIEFFKPGESQPVKGGKDRGPVRYVPLISGRKAGWLIVQDTRSNEPEDLLDFEENPSAPVVAPSVLQPVTAPTQVEPAPPEEFEWHE